MFHNLRGTRETQIHKRPELEKVLQSKSPRVVGTKILEGRKVGLFRVTKERGCKPSDAKISRNTGRSHLRSPLRLKTFPGFGESCPRQRQLSVFPKTVYTTVMRAGDARRDKA